MSDVESVKALRETHRRQVARDAIADCRARLAAQRAQADAKKPQQEHEQ